MNKEERVKYFCAGYKDGFIEGYKRAMRAIKKDSESSYDWLSEKIGGIRDVRIGELAEAFLNGERSDD